MCVVIGTISTHRNNVQVIAKGFGKRYIVSLFRDAEQSW